MEKLSVKKEEKVIKVITISSNNYKNLDYKKVSDVLEINYPSFSINDRQAVLETTKTGKFHSFKFGCQTIKEDILKEVLSQLNEEKVKTIRLFSLKTGKKSAYKVKDKTDKYFITTTDRALLRSEYKEKEVEEIVTILTSYRNWEGITSLQYKGNTVCDKTKASKNILKTKVEILLEVIKIINEDN